MSFSTFQPVQFGGLPPLPPPDLDEHSSPSEWFRDIAQIEGFNEMKQERDKKAPLIVAVCNRNLDQLKALLEEGVEVNQRYSFTVLGETCEKTALEEAIEHSHKAEAEMLLRHGADGISRNPRDETPLEIAVQCGDAPIARLLLDVSHADIHELDKNQRAVLSVALKQLKYMFLRGTRSPYPVSHRRTPRDWREAFAVTTLLIDRDADVNAPAKEVNMYTLACREVKPLHLAVECLDKKNHHHGVVYRKTLNCITRIIRQLLMKGAELRDQPPLQWNLFS